MAALALGVACAAPASAAVLTFDDLPNVQEDLIPDGYGGFDWTNAHYVRATDFPNSGYYNGVVSGEFMGFNGFNNPLLASAAPFDFEGGYFVSAWRDNLDLLVEGYRGGSQVYSQNIVLSTDDSVWHSFNYLNIDELRFTPSGGTPHPGYSFSGVYFAMDDFTYQMPTAVPEPGTLALLLVGGAVAVRRRWR